MTTNIVLLGAASQVGYRLLPLLEQAGYQALAVSRSGRPSWAQQRAGTKWLTPRELKAHKSLCATLISTGPLALATEIMLDMSDLQQVVALSSASVQFKSSSGNRAEEKMMANLKEGEQLLEQLCNARLIPLTIFRPTLIYGSGLDENLCRLARWAIRFGWLPVAGSGAGLRQPIYSGDLAELIMEVIKTPAGRAGVFPVAGASQVSYREMLAAVLTALGKNPRVIQFPVPVFRLLLRLFALLRPGTGISAQMADRQNRDLLVDTGKMQEAFNFKPGEFRLHGEHLLPP